MAEIVGVVASGIAITTLATKVVKLRDCWEQIQDAPADISILLRQIECFNILISQIQAGPQIPNLVFDNACLIQSLSLCEEGINELTDLVTELDGKIRDKGGWRKKLGGAKVVLKKDDLKRAKSRIKSAIQLLTLAHQCHTATMIQLQPEIIVARVAQHIQIDGAKESSLHSVVELVRNDKEEPPEMLVHDLVTKQYDAWISSTPWMKCLLGSFEYHSRTRLQKGMPKLEFEAKYNLPYWMSQTALHVQGYNYFSQWRVNYQAYRLVSKNSSFFQAIRGGHIKSVQRMIVDKTAFVTDRESSEGNTVIHIAIKSGHLEMLRLLLSEGANPTQPNYRGSTPLDMVFFRAMGPIARRVETSPELFRLLLNSKAINELHEIDDKIWFRGGPITIFKSVQNQMYPPYYERPLAERMEWASEICAFSGGLSNGAILVELALNSDGIVTPEVATWRDKSSKESMLFFIARALVASSQIYHEYIDKDLTENYRRFLKAQPTTKYENDLYRDCTKLWAPLIQRFVEAGADIHALNLLSHTPLDQICLDIISLMFAGQTTEIELLIQGILLVWLTALYDAGINLQQYGEKERELGTYAFSRHECWEGNILLVGMKYGPLPSDWGFYFGEFTDNFAGEFWQSLDDGLWDTYTDESDEEDLGHCIPGAWEAEDEE